MACVRVVIYRDGSDEILEDFYAEDPDKNSYRVAEEVKNSVPEEIYIGEMR